jgi:hypothetical protein
MSSAPASTAPGVTFEVDRFEWGADDRLEVVGRWFGLRGHRFLRPTLDVEVGGERRRMLAVLDHKPWAAEEGEEWVAAFAWAGGRARLDDAELTVSPDLAVQLPLPDSAGVDPPPEAVATAERVPARRPRTAVLEGELAAALAEVARREEELAGLRETHSDVARELRERARTAQESVRGLESELQKARDQLAAAQAKAEQELGQLREERDAAAADRERAEAEMEKVRAERDAAVKKLAAAEIDNEALTEARDRAREERNAWMSRARAAAAEARGASPIADRVPAPPPRPPREPEPIPPPGEPIQSPPAEPPPARDGRRTIQIGDRPGPLRPAPPPPGAMRSLDERWTPRLIAVIALGAFVVVVLLLLLLAF